MTKLKQSIDTMLDIVDKNPQALTAFTTNILYKHFISIIESLRVENINNLKSLSNIETTNYIRGKINALEDLIEVIASVTTIK